MRPLVLIVLLALLFALPAHAETADPTETVDRITLEQAREIEGLFDAYDPMERMNRRLYWFNARFDDYVFLPAVRGYEFILPGIVRTGVRNFFSNLAEITTFLNSVLQLRPKRSAGTLGRFAVNTTVGIAGLWDPATRLGMRRYEEDFGQTLGWWGLGAGPYLVIPFLGPSSVRDGFGMAVDRVPFVLVGFPPLWSFPIEAVDTRANNPFRYGDLGGPFEYDLVRFLALERRKILVAE